MFLIHKQNEFLTKDFKPKVWTNFDILKRLAKTRREIGKQVQFGLVTNLYSWVFTMYYRPETYVYETRANFVESKVFELPVDLQGGPDRHKLLLDYKGLMFHFNELLLIDRTPERIIKEEVEIIQLMQEVGILDIQEEKIKNEEPQEKGPLKQPDKENDSPEKDSEELKPKSKHKVSFLDRFRKKL